MSTTLIYTNLFIKLISYLCHCFRSEYINVIIEVICLVHLLSAQLTTKSVLTVQTDSGKQSFHLEAGTDHISSRPLDSHRRLLEAVAAASVQERSVASCVQGLSKQNSDKVLRLVNGSRVVPAAAAQLHARHNNWSDHRKIGPFTIARHAPI